MALYDNNGTTSTPLGKVYDFNGTAATQIAKAYDFNGVSSALLYASKRILYANGTQFVIWDTNLNFYNDPIYYHKSPFFNYTGSRLEIVSVQESDGCFITQQKIDVSGFDRLFFAVDSTSAVQLKSFGLSTTVDLALDNHVAVGTYNPGTSASGIVEINVSSISGAYHVFFGMVHSHWEIEYGHTYVSQIWLE